MAIIRMNYGLNLPDPTIMMQSMHQAVDYAMDNQNIENKKNTVTTSPIIDNIEQILNLLSQHKHLDLIQLLQMKSTIQNVSSGSLEIMPIAGFKIERQDIIALKAILENHTNIIWNIICHKNEGSENKKTLYEQQKEKNQQLIEKAQKDPTIKIILDEIPKSKILQVTDSNSLPHK